MIGKGGKTHLDNCPCYRSGQERKKREERQEERLEERRGELKREGRGKKDRRRE